MRSFLAVVGAVSLVCITVMGSQVEVHNDFHLLGKHLKRVLLEERITDDRDGIEVEFGSEVGEDIVSRG
jgi:hypothetical protein